MAEVFSQLFKLELQLFVLKEVCLPVVLKIEYLEKKIWFASNKMTKKKGSHWMSFI